MKGIILAGGAGTRLYPVTQVISKQLLPVYDKPMVYYPLSILMLSGIREILIISTPHDLPLYERLLGNGKQWGIELHYKVQQEPKGLAQAFTIGESFIGNDSVSLVLGDNLLFGHNLRQMLMGCSSMVRQNNGGVIIGYHVQDPERYGVVEFDKDGRVLGIEEKPENPKSNYAVIGIYYYDNQVIEIAKNLKPSKRGEFEITDVNRTYLENKQLNVEIMGRGYAWLDTGTHHSLLDAGNFIQTIEERQGTKIACLEEIALENEWIDQEDLKANINPAVKSTYNQYLIQLAEKP